MTAARSRRTTRVSGRCGSTAGTPTPGATSPPCARSSTASPAPADLGDHPSPGYGPGHPLGHPGPAGDHGELGLDVLPDPRPARPGAGPGLPRGPVHDRLGGDPPGLTAVRAPAPPG